MSTVTALGLEYHIEAIVGGKEVTVELVYKPTGGSDMSPDTVKVSTVGMNALGAYYMGSLHSSDAVNIADTSGIPTDKFVASVGNVEYPDNPAYVVVDLEKVVSTRILDKVKNGTYIIINTTVFVGGFGVPLDDSIFAETTFTTWLADYTSVYDPTMTASTLYSWMLGVFNITTYNSEYKWLLPKIYETGSQVFQIQDYATGMKVTEITVNILNFDLEYVGGTSDTAAKQEGLVDLDDEYYLKGYMLKITSPDIEAGTTVTWNITKAGSPIGTYHNGSAWTDYETPLSSIPTTQAIYWRSDIIGSITDEYKISATFTPLGASSMVTCSYDIKSRELDSNVASHRDNFNEDADMLQRIMLQLFYLDKGRLDYFRRGQYDTYSQNGFYHSNYYPPRNVPDWSSIADEIWNFDKFTLGNNSAPDPRSLDLSVIQGIWSEFSLILAAGIQPPQNRSTPAYEATWIPCAVTTSELTMPADFPRTPAELLKALVTQEGKSHSFERFDPLAVSSINIGQTLGYDGGAHTLTDGGIGYCKVQPYRAGGRNLYDPQENLIRGAEILQENIYDGLNPGADDAEKVWYALFKYNHGNYSSGSPTTLRNGNKYEKDSAGYADAIFGFLGVTVP